MAQSLDLNLNDELDLGLDDSLDLDLGNDLNLGLTSAPEEEDEVSPWEAGWDRFTGGAAKTTGQFLTSINDSPIGEAMQYHPAVAGLNMMFDKDGSPEDNVFADLAKNSSQYANEAFENSKKYIPEVKSYKDIDSLGKLGTYVSESLASGSTEIGSFLLGRFTLPLQVASYVGQTVQEQEGKGNKADWGRAAVTGSLEAVLNTPITKATSRVISQIGKSGLKEEAKRNAIKDVVVGISTDAGVGGIQQILRNYGVENAVSLDDVDEAIVGGLIVGAPLRGAQAFTNKYVADQLTEVASKEAVDKGDIRKADGMIQSALNFTMGNALRPVRRLAATEAGALMFKNISNMQHERELMASEGVQKVREIFKSVKDEKAFIKDYTSGKRDTVPLRQLGELMDYYQERAADPMGANLGTAKIDNYAPSHIDLETFDTKARQNMATDYRNWYNNMPAEYVAEKNLVHPDKALKHINNFVKKTEAVENNPNNARMPRLKIDEDGNVISTTSPINIRNPLKSSSLEHSRYLGFIPQHIISQYAVDKNYMGQFEGYVQSIAQRVTYAEQLGANNEKLNILINEANKNLPKDKKLLSKELDNIYDSMDAYQGIYGQFESKSTRKLATAVRTATNFVALPLTLLSSFTEPFNLAIKVGNVEAGKAFAKALGSISQDLISTVTMGLTPKSEVNKQLLLAGRSMNEATNVLNNRINGDTLGSFTTGANNLFFHVTGQTAMNYLVNTMAAHAADSQVKADIYTLGGKEGTRAYEAAKGRLSDLNITVEEAKQMAHNNALLRARMPGIVSRFNHDIALNPTALEKPLWMATGWGAMFSQLRGYPTMFTNSVLPKFLDMLDPRGKTPTELAMSIGQFSTTIGAILTVGFLQESIKNEVKGGDESDEEILMKAIQNTLMPIHMSYLLNSVTGRGISGVVVPASAGVMDRQVGILRKAMRGEDVDLKDLPFLSSFKGVIE